MPKNNRVSWRGNSGLKDGLPDVVGGLVGGYYDGGSNTKFHFPMAFSMTMLSWSLIEYSQKFKAINEYDHMRDVLKWGTDYLLLTFNNSATRLDHIYAQVFVLLLCFFISFDYVVHLHNHFNFSVNFIGRKSTH